MTTLFETPAEPKPPWWLRHTDDIDKQHHPHTDYLTCLPDHICPWCMEDVGGLFCHCDSVKIAKAEQAGTPEISIDMKGDR